MRSGLAPILFSRPGWVPSGSSLAFDFTRGAGWTPNAVRPAAGMLTTVAASDRYGDFNSGFWQAFTSNQPRITDKGLLVEEARTNSIRNNSAQGAVAGTPGTAPTNWAIAATGLTIELVGTGTNNGVDYVDYRLSGTTGATSGTISFETSTGVAATTGQVWTESAFLALVGGATTNISQMFFTITENTAAGAFVANNDGSDFLSSLTSTLTRFSAVRTLAGGGTVGCAQPRLRFAWPNGVAIDITLRIGWPQLELGSFATSPIRTTAGAATRAADVITVNNFSSWYNASAGTVFTEWQFLTGAATTGSIRGVVSLDDGTISNRILNFVGPGGTVVGSRMVAGGVATNPGDTAAFVAGTNKIATAYAVGASQGAVSLNGVTPTTSSPASAFSGVTTARLGNTSSGTEFMNGLIRRFAYKPVRDPNAQLQAMTV